MSTTMKNGELVNNSSSAIDQSTITNGIKITEFSRRIGDQLILYQIIRYPDRCLFIWIGTSSCDISNLAMTMPRMSSSSASSNEFLGTTLFGVDFYEQSLSLSKKVARRLGGQKQIYISLNLSNDADNEMLLGEIEQALFEHIRQNEQDY
ncbi:unnamed protein product [Rotaria magnacalcarata]|uniref:Proteasome assembly chaperone 4 n=1 Tax=Rotaria magnacalcarata TaxID=392030 RepID=A0A816KT87_9BILA|nr:unnamed protein product [Rotaria magnacalcarata]CAF1393105.1 unnamed protein product [Rotaria magnacalcarata]CAF1923012.1 unnamed protein product [Rotaria magnacalcarata]CAF1932456.1 unnamed protein product [Rotaria magnacalcarata]CAF3977642.1 unnamed protein product [Rotaria magnacalcarata]